ncbi:hypothetical protein MMC17_008981 [Xylographa soralifera]|nr:hypothetical protein [Xylographa soralifera]
MPHALLGGLELSEKTKELLEIENSFVVGGFSSLPAFFVRGKGAKLWDVDGNEYVDLISMFSAVNQGHSHPRIIAALVDQACQVPLVNLATHGPKWPKFARMMCQRFHYDKIASMVTGAEAVDTACKVAQKWGCVRKGIASQEVLVLGVAGNYHGLTAGVWGLMAPSRTRTFEEEIKYARGVYDLCKRHGILFIADEVKMGAAKTGKFFSFQHLGDDCKPDLVAIGKSITGGVYPASFVLGTDDVMGLIGPYEVASTFAAAPLGIATAEAAIAVIDDEGLDGRAVFIGLYFERVVRSWSHEHVQRVSTRGADMRIWINEDHPSGRVSARWICALCLQNYLLVYPKANVIRMSAPLVISNTELDSALAIIQDALNSVISYGLIPGEEGH